MNNVIFSGIAASNIETKMVYNQQVSTFSIAVKRSYKNKQTNQYDADFFTCEAWGNVNKIAKFVTKGRKVMVRGELKNNHYTHPSSGLKQYQEVLVLQSVEFLDKNKETGNEIIGSANY